MMSIKQIWHCPGEGRCYLIDKYPQEITRDQYIGYINSQKSGARLISKCFEHEDVLWNSKAFPDVWNFPIRLEDFNNVQPFVHLIKFHTRDFLNPCLSVVCSTWCTPARPRGKKWSQKIRSMDGWMGFDEIFKSHEHSIKGGLLGQYFHILMGLKNTFQEWSYGNIWK